MSILTTAQQYLGLEETPGSGNNPTIMEWAQTLNMSYPSDATAWCALFMSWVAHKAGYEGLYTLRARDWLKVGTPVTDPQPGDVAILWRGSPTSGLGHVGIVSDSTADKITLLGGNQSDAVGYATFPKTRVLGYRRLSPKTESTSKPKSKKKKLKR